MYHIFFTHSSVGEHLVFFRSLVIINSPAVNTEMCTSFQINVFVFSGYMPRSRIAGSHGSPVFTFLRNLHTVLHSGCTSLHSHQQWPRVSISPQPCQHLLFVFYLLMAVLIRGRCRLIVVNHGFSFLLTSFKIRGQQLADSVALTWFV